ncbi:MAG: LacI family DNA-binding transcriptional regulator [Armatimonadota bacterium]|nr:LacI family DNA-binding transcriptional regulator [Armatimonadota bacterium]
MTIRDVARRAGVSPATVSRVLNASSHPVSEWGRRRVLTAARQLSYIPNLLARSLLTHETAAIGVLIPDVSNPYYAAVLRGVEDAIGPSGRTVILCNTDRDPAKQRLYLRALMERRVDGIIVAGGTFGRPEMAITGRALAVVMIGQHRVRFPSVRVDNVAAAAVATEHLLNLGHRRIACLAGPSVSLTAADRVTGYRRALVAAGVPVDPALIREVGFTPTGTRESVRALFGATARPTALLAPNDQVAIGVIRALHELGLRVPADVSVVGFDDTPVASYTVPSLTTVAIPMHDLGRTAVELLVKVLEGRRAESVVLPCALRIRESTAPIRRRGD